MQRDEHDGLWTVGVDIARSAIHLVTFKGTGSSKAEASYFRRIVVCVRSSYLYFA